MLGKAAVAGAPILSTGMPATAKAQLFQHTCFGTLTTATESAIAHVGKVEKRLLACHPKEHTCGCVSCLEQVLHLQGLQELALLSLQLLRVRGLLHKLSDVQPGLTLHAVAAGALSVPINIPDSVKRHNQCAITSRSHEMKRNRIDRWGTCWEVAAIWLGWFRSMPSNAALVAAGSTAGTAGLATRAAGTVKGATDGSALRGSSTRMFHCASSGSLLTAPIDTSCCIVPCSQTHLPMKATSEAYCSSRLIMPKHMVLVWTYPHTCSCLMYSTVLPRNVALSILSWLGISAFSAAKLQHTFALVSRHTASMCWKLTKKEMKFATHGSSAAPFIYPITTALFSLDVAQA